MRGVDEKVARPSRRCDDDSSYSHDLPLRIYEGDCEINRVMGGRGIRMDGTKREKEHNGTNQIWMIAEEKEEEEGKRCFPIPIQFHAHLQNSYQFQLSGNSKGLKLHKKWRE